MKYFIDFEFLEGDVPCQIKGFNIPRWLIKPNNTIQPISVGICSSDDREYYAISKDFNLKEAWNRYDLVKYSFRDFGLTPNYKKVYWIRDNVLKPIFIELRAKEVEEYNIAQRRNVVLDFPTYSFCFKEFKRLLNKYGKTNKQIAEEVYEFCSNDYHKGNNLTFQQRREYPLYDKFKPEFYGYYSDYDWVVLCWLFGRMIDLPKGFPMYCIDLKQELDRIQEIRFGLTLYKGSLANDIKTLPDYPKQTNEHNALADARWNYELYKFLNTL